MPSVRLLRFTGLLYLGLAIVGVLGLKVIPGLVISDDAVTTLGNLRALQPVFRSAIAVELVGQGLFLFVPLALYRVFRNTNAELAVLMVILGIISVPIAFVAVASELGAVWVANASELIALAPPHELDALAIVLLRLHGEILLTATVFWGLWLVPLALLELRAAFVPRLVGVLVMVAACTYVFDALVSVVLPAQADALSGLMSVGEAGELATMLWLLVARPISAPRRALAVGA